MKESEIIKNELYPIESSWTNFSEVRYYYKVPEIKDEIIWLPRRAHYAEVLASAQDEKIVAEAGGREKLESIRDAYNKLLIVRDKYRGEGEYITNAGALEEAKDALQTINFGRKCLWLVVNDIQPDFSYSEIFAGRVIDFVEEVAVPEGKLKVVPRVETKSGSAIDVHETKFDLFAEHHKNIPAV